MLIEFNVTNFRSIYNTQTLSLVADSEEERVDSNTCSVGFSDLPRLVKSAVIYGPNAAGKSHLIRAIGFMQEFVKNSANNSDESIDVKPFMLHENSKNAPSEFELIFIQEGMRYQYGFAVTPKRVMQEWLFAYPNGSGEQWLERFYDPQTQQESWFVSDKLSNRMDLHELWKAATKPNVLFLSMVEIFHFQEQSKKLAAIFDWITQTLIVFKPQRELLSQIKQCKEPLYKSTIMKFLRVADLNIIDIQVETKSKTLQFVHYQNDTHDKVLLAADEESEGTRKLVALASFVMDMLTKGYVLMVDEFDNSLHPIIVRFLVELFHNTSLNKKNAQLVFTTHDSSTLDSTLFRRDQVWFVQKDQEQATQLYPLTDFQPRPHEALQRYYLEGRYGALPFIGELKFDGNG